MAQLAAVAAGGHGPARSLQPQPSRIDRQIVQRTDEEEHSCKQQEFML